MFEIIKYPVLTEKTTRSIEKYNQYTFAVSPRLTKAQIRSMIEEIFMVRVVRVNTNRLIQKKRCKRKRGNVSKVSKRAIVTVARGEKITFF